MFDGRSAICRRHMLSVKGSGASYLLVNLLSFQAIEDPVPRHDALGTTSFSRMTSQATLGLFAKPDPEHEILR